MNVRMGLMFVNTDTASTRKVAIHASVSLDSNLIKAKHFVSVSPNLLKDIEGHKYTTV